MSDTFWVAGTILYWAEGAKTRNHLALNNTDPRALRLFITWVRTYLQPDAAFSLQLHLHEGNDEETAKEHWRNQTGLHDANFHKTFIKPAGTDTGITDWNTAFVRSGCGEPPTRGTSLWRGPT